MVDMVSGKLPRGKLPPVRARSGLGLALELGLGGNFPRGQFFRSGVYMLPNLERTFPH